jgi:FemAB-related protein (PEP-CTERM system-associated)
VINPADHSSASSVRTCAAPGADWDACVARLGGSIYLRSGWSQLAQDVFGHRAIFFEARATDGRLSGILPVVQQRGLLGNFATSVPFFNYGGALAEDDATALALMGRARQQTRELGCSYLELRDVKARASDWEVRTDKAAMILELPSTREALSKQLGSKLRSQIKRADRENIEIRRGGAELLDAFYAVFARNMRDLGTPVYPKRFFRRILERFAGDTQIIVIELRGLPAAVGFLVFDGASVEIPWAACRADAKPLGMNMKLYWELLCVAVERAARSFDFGRSTIDSGTYKFKQQWGAEPRQLYWYRWERRPRASAASGEAHSRGRGIDSMVAMWKKLPLPVANALGSWISPGLPW